MTESLRDRAIAAVEEKNAKHRRRDENIERLKQESLAAEREKTQRLVYRVIGYTATNPGEGQSVYCNGIQFALIGGDNLQATVTCPTCATIFSTTINRIGSRERAHCAIGEAIQRAERCQH